MKQQISAFLSRFASFINSERGIASVAAISTDNMANNIERIHEESTRFIQAYAAQAMLELNARADEVLDEMALDHHARMEELDNTFESRQEHRSLMDDIAPFTSVEDWFDHLPDDEKYSWQDIYQEYMYGPNGDAVICDSNRLGWEVMSVLRSRDSYLKQPFCPYCDSRGHKSGECMENSAPQLGH